MIRNTLRQLEDEAYLHAKAEEREIAKCAKKAADRSADVGDWKDAQAWYGKAGEHELQQEAITMAEEKERNGR